MSGQGPGIPSEYFRPADLNDIEGLMTAARLEPGFSSNDSVVFQRWVEIISDHRI